MSSGHRGYNFVGGDNIDNSGMVWDVLKVIIICIAVALVICWAAACSPKIVERVVTEIEYRDRVVRDTATFEVPVEVEKVVTCDTMSHLENTYAKSDAVVSNGFLHHSLESKPTIIKIPVEVHVTDTVWKQSEVIEKEIKVEKELTWWQKTRLDAFWGLVLSDRKSVV